MVAIVQMIPRTLKVGCTQTALSATKAAPDSPLNKSLKRVTDNRKQLFDTVQLLLCPRYKLIIGPGLGG